MLALLWERIWQHYFYHRGQLSHFLNTICRRTPRQSQVFPPALPNLPQLNGRKLHFQSLDLATFQSSCVSYYSPWNWFLRNLCHGLETERENSTRPRQATICGHSLALWTWMRLKMGSASISISSRAIGNLSPTELIPTTCLDRKQVETNVSIT